MRYVDADFDQIAFGALVEELAGSFSPSFFVVVGFAVSCWKVGESIAEQLLLLGVALTVCVFKEPQFYQARVNWHLSSFPCLDSLCLEGFRIVRAEVEAWVPVDLSNVGGVELCDFVCPGASEVSD